jgi:hypothetical protein
MSKRQCSFTDTLKQEFRFLTGSHKVNGEVLRTVCRAEFSTEHGYYKMYNHF